MRIPRIYLPLNFNTKNVHELTAHAFQHVVKVLRMKEAEKLVVFDGKGSEYFATLQQVNKKNAFVLLDKKIDNNTESNLLIHLGLGVSKGERMDFAIQKAVELGVTEITPLFTEHCVVNLDEKRVKKRLQHWQGIIISACEQSGRSVLPKLNNIIKISAWTESIKQTCLVFDPLSTKSIKEIKPENDYVNLVIGPEGGLSQTEIIEMNKKECFHTVKLGTRILRTETAAVSAITAIQILWGDLLN